MYFKTSYLSSHVFHNTNNLKGKQNSSYVSYQIINVKVLSHAAKYDYGSLNTIRFIKFLIDCK